MALKVLYEKKESEKSNSISFYLTNPNQKLKVNLDKNQWRISFQFESKFYRYRKIGTLQPNKIQNIQDRLKQWEEIILHLFDLLLNDYNAFIDFLNEKKDNRNLLLTDISKDYLDYVDKTNKASTYTKYKGSNAVFIRLFGQYTIQDLHPKNKPLIVEKINKELSNYSPKQYNELVSYFSRVIGYLNSNLSHYELEKEYYNPFQFDRLFKKKIVKKSDLHRLFTDNDYYSIRKYILDHEMYMLDLAMSLIYDCHIRISELQSIQLKHIDITKGTIQIYSIDVKTNVRICRLSIETTKKINDLITIHNIDTSKQKDLYIFGYKALFFQTKQIGETYLTEQFSSVRDALKLDKNYTLYGTKHYANGIKYTKLKARNTPYSQIISILMNINGHKNASMTETYLRDTLNIHDDSTTELMDYVLD